jgi:phosphoribosylanthranilate isomerase
MSLMIKICGLRDPRAIGAAIDAGADAVGFVFAESVRRIEPGEAAGLAAGLPTTVKRVAVMRHPSVELWQSVLAVFQPQVVQTDVADFDYLEVPPGIETWPVYREGQSLDSVPARFVYEGGHSGSGRTVDWQRAAEIAANGEMILAGGLRPENIAQAIRTVRPYGVDVSSGVESAPGIKDVNRIRAFIAAARAAETEA